MFELLGLFNVARIYDRVFNVDEAVLVIKADDSQPNNHNLIATEIPQSNEQKIIPDRLNLKYSGRVNWKDPQAPAFSYPGTASEFNFTGTSLKIELSEHNWGDENYLDIYLDDNPKPVTIQLEGNWGKPLIYDIASGLENKSHRATIVKRNDYITGHFQLHGIIIDGELPLARKLKQERAVNLSSERLRRILKKKISLEKNEAEQ